MWGSQQVRAQKQLLEVLRQNFALAERFAGFGNRTEHHGKLVCEGRRMYGMATSYGEPPYPEGRNINWNDRLNPIAPVFKYNLEPRRV